MDPIRQRREGAGGRVAPPVRQVVIASLLGLASSIAAAQDDGLNPTQRAGRQVFAQSCGICHLQPQRGAATYGPRLNQASASGSDELMRGFITQGTPRMPAFKFYLTGEQMDSVIAYLRTIPAPADAQAKEKAQ
jgi:mono/diheme cytochrome c family protein